MKIGYLNCRMACQAKYAECHIMLYHLIDSIKMIKIKVFSSSVEGLWFMRVILSQCSC